jgi:hypothetical protein
MFGFMIGSSPGDARWSYDDPSGLPEEVSVTMHLPEPLLESVRAEAARSGVTPAGWLLDLVERTLRARPSAA